MQALILAAGKGKRLQPFTLTRSKGMAPIVGKPMCARVVDTFIAAGISEFVIVVSPNDSELQLYFDSAYANVSIKYVVQQERLGMAHAINCAKDVITGDFIVSAADSLVSHATILALLEKFSTSNSAIVLTLLPVKDDKVSKSGIVSFDSKGNIIKIVEKPKLEDAPSKVCSLPLYIFKHELFDYLPKVPLSPRGEYEVQDAIQMVIEKYGSICGVMADYRLDLTTPDDLLAISLKYLSDIAKNVLKSAVPATSKVLANVYISKNVVIGDNCIIGPNVYLEDGSVIKDNVTISNSVVLRGHTVEQGEVVTNTILM